MYDQVMNGSLQILLLTLVFLLDASALQCCARDEVRACNFGQQNRFSKLNEIRLRLLAQDGVTVTDDLHARYNREKSLVWGKVSFLAEVDAQGSLVKLLLMKSSGDKLNDENAKRAIAAAAPFKTLPKKPVKLIIRFENDVDIVYVQEAENQRDFGDF